MTLYRVELKQAAATALAGISGVKNVFIDRSLPMTPAMLPAIIISCPRDNGVSAGRAQPQFTRVSHLYVHARLCHTSPENAEVEVEAFAEQIELAIMLDAGLQAMLTQVTEIETEVEINSKTAEHTGEVNMHFGLEYIETYPPPGTPLTEITGTMTANGNADFAGMQTPTSLKPRPSIMFVKPAPGRSVRWPGTMRLLKAQGETVPETGFWLLCLHNGDVVQATPPAASAAPVSPSPSPTHLSGDAAAIHEPAEAHA